MLKCICPHCADIVNLEFSPIHEDDHIVLRKAICHNCNKPIVQTGIIYIETKEEWVPGCPGKRLRVNKKIDYEIAYPKLKNICVNPLIPSNLRKIINEAYSNLDVSLIGAAGLARVALENFLVDHLKITGGTLENKIDRIPLTYINQDHLHAVRLCANYGLHPEKSITIDRENAQFTILIIKDMFEHHFVKLPYNQKMSNEIHNKKKP